MEKIDCPVSAVDLSEKLAALLFCLLEIQRDCPRGKNDSIGHLFQKLKIAYVYSTRNFCSCMNYDLSLRSKDGGNVTL